MLKGASTDLYKKILNELPELYLIASGGVSKIEDIIELDNAGVPAVITGKAIYEGKITLKQISNLLAYSSTKIKYIDNLSINLQKIPDYDY